MFTFFRYSFEGVLRNRRRSLFAALGIALAMALVSGSLIAVDSSAYGLLRAAVDKVDVDFVASGYNAFTSAYSTKPLNDSVTAIESVDKVQEADPYITISGWTTSDASNLYPSYYGGYYLAFLPSECARFLRAEQIIGTMPETGTVAIPKQTADELGIGVSDQMNLTMMRSTYGGYNNTTMTYEYTNTYLNLTFTVSQIWEQNYSADRGNRQPIDAQGQQTSGPSPSVVLPEEWGTPIVMNLETFHSMMPGYNGSYISANTGISVRYLIWIDRDSVIDLADIPGTVKGLDFIQHRIERQGQVYGFTVQESRLASALGDLQPQLEAQKMLFLALSLPVVALGTYLSVVGVDLGVTSRRREIGILKSRGASNRHIFFSLIMESVMLGTFAAVIGLLMGVLVSRFLLGSALSISSSGSGGSYSWTDFKLSGSSIELTVFFGIGLMLLSSWRPFRRASKTDVAEALHHYSQAAAKADYKPTVDIILLVLSILSIVSIMSGFSWVSNTSWSWITKVIVAFVMVIGIAMFPLMPFTLSLSVIRLITRGPRKLYSRLSWFVKGWTKELHQLVDRNIVRNPRRASNIAVIISLALAFGLFISVTMESSISLAREQVKFDVGTDVKVSGYPRGGSINTTELDALQTLAGTSHVAMFDSLYLQTTNLQYGGMPMQTFLINATTYSKAVNPSDFYFVHSNKGMLAHLAVNGSIILNTNFAERTSTLVGDKIAATLLVSQSFNGSLYQSISYPLVLDVIGMVKGLPGLGYSDAIIDARTLGWIPERNLTSAVQSMGALIDVSGGSDARAVGLAAEEIFTKANMTASLTLMEDQLAALEDDPAFGSLADYLYMEYAMSVIIMSVGVGLIIFVAVTDREQELACIMARGSSGSQMRKILMGESITLMILGLSVGAIVGVITAFLFNTLTQPGSGDVIPHRMVFTYVTWAMVLVAASSLVVAALLATARAGRIRLAEVLRIRGG